MATLNKAAVTPYEISVWNLLRFLLTILAAILMRGVGFIWLDMLIEDEIVEIRATVIDRSNKDVFSG
jgi:hypothetical protein